MIIKGRRVSTYEPHGHGAKKKFEETFSLSQGKRMKLFVSPNIIDVIHQC